MDDHCTRHPMMAEAQLTPHLSTNRSRLITAHSRTGGMRTTPPLSQDILGEYLGRLHGLIGRVTRHEPILGAAL